MPKTRVSKPSTSSVGPAEVAVTPSKYLEILLKTGRDLNLIEEVPASRPSSPTAEKRAETLKERAKEAYDLAKGDPADGKWVHLAEMLRLGCTRPRYRCWPVGLHEEQAKLADDDISPELEQDFVELDKRKHEGAKLKERVENWKARVNAAPEAYVEGPPIPLSFLAAIENSSGSKETGSRTGSGKPNVKVKEKKERSQMQDPKDQSSLGFPVVKHASMATTSSKRTIKKSLPIKPSPSSGPTVGKNLPDESLPKAISDVDEMSFLPPSFPVQLQTSTPNPLKEPLESLPARDKPPPIPPRSQLDVPSPPFPVPASSQANQPSSPHRITKVVPSSFPVSPSRKRVRPLTPPSDDADSALLTKTPPPSLKQARVMPDVFYDPPPVPSGSLPKTPPRSASPRSNSPDLLDYFAPSTPQGQLPTLTELLVSADRVKARTRQIMDPITKDDELPRRKESRRCIDDDNYLLMKTSLNGHHSSRSHSPDLPAFTQDPGAFVPDFLSTQAQFDVPAAEQLGIHIGGIDSSAGTPMDHGSSEFFGTGYNSQFDVEGQVDRVSELLERDVDFDGWLNDMHDGEEVSA